MAARNDVSVFTRLGGLLEVSRLIRSEEDLPVLLAAIARTISDSLGFRTVAINLYRPAWDDFLVTTVHGPDAARDALLGDARTIEEWQPLLDDRFLRRGAYFVHAGQFDWNDGRARYIPPLDASPAEDAWHPEDALFVAMRHVEGHLLGIVSVDEPFHGRRPSDDELDVLVAVADHAALAVQHAQEASEARRHRVALEQLLAVSSRLTAASSVDDILRAVCGGIRDALGFRNVAAELVEPASGLLVPRAAAGWRLDGPALRPVMSVADVEPLLDPQFEIEGCFLVPHDAAVARVDPDTVVYVPEMNGRGRDAWSRHWLLVPLHGRGGDVIGMIWVDEPEDRLLPSRERLQALRVFANQAAAALASAEQTAELRFLADHDPLTRLLNRRAFIGRLDSEVAGAARYGRTFSLALCDLDGFKAVNDRHGHPGGDQVLELFATIVCEALRRPDDAFRIGGDEFAFLLAEASEDDATEVVARICRRLDESGDERLDGLRASFGIASWPGDARDAQALFRRADEALYKAKRAGVSLQFAA